MFNALLLVLHLAGPALAANPTKPHPHQGTATKFVNPKRTQLTDAENQTIKNGGLVKKQARTDKGGRGIAILDIAATKRDILAVITDYDEYPNFIDRMEKAEIYKENEKEIYTTFVLNATVSKIEYYIYHKVDRRKGLITWTLDYTRESDFDDSTGYWLVYRSPDDPQKTRLEYSVDLRLKGWVPKFVEKLLADQGLEDATKWVKKQAESR